MPQRMALPSFPPPFCSQLLPHSLVSLSLTTCYNWLQLLSTKCPVHCFSFTRFSKWNWRVQFSSKYTWRMNQVLSNLQLVSSNFPLLETVISSIRLVPSGAIHVLVFFTENSHAISKCPSFPIHSRVPLLEHSAKTSLIIRPGFQKSVPQMYCTLC